MVRRLARCFRSGGAPTVAPLSGPKTPNRPGGAVSGPNHLAGPLPGPTGTGVGSVAAPTGSAAARGGFGPGFGFFWGGSGLVAVGRRVDTRGAESFNVRIADDSAVFQYEIKAARSVQTNSGVDLVIVVAPALIPPQY